MSQDWTVLDGSAHTVSDIDDVVMYNLNDLRTSFSGSSSPAGGVVGPVPGQWWYNTDTQIMYARNDTEWKFALDLKENFGGLLPVAGETGYPMAGNLYMSGPAVNPPDHQIKQLKDPTDRQDAATMNWVYSTIDAHTHTGAADSGDPIPYTNLGEDPEGSTANTLLSLNPTADGLVERQIGAYPYTGGISVGLSAWTTLAAVTVDCNIGETKYIIAGTNARTDKTGTYQLRFTVDGVVFFGPNSFPFTIGSQAFTGLTSAGSHVVTVDGSQEFAIQGYSDTTASSWILNWIFVI